MGDLCRAGRWPGEACRSSCSSEWRAGVVLAKERGSEDAMGLEDSLMYWKLLGRSGGVEEFLEVGGVEERGRWSLRGRVDDLGDQLGVAIHHCSTLGGRKLMGISAINERNLQILPIQFVNRMFHLKLFSH